MVSKASDDLPDPDNPVMTVSRSRGMETLMFLRLCSRAPRTNSASSAIAGVSWKPERDETSRYIPISPPRLPTPMPHTDAVVVLTTVANEDEAVQLVRTLLDRRLIACGTLLPGARSLYRWQGKIADEREHVLLLKTRSARVDALRTAFGELHPYKVPEMLVLSVDTGLDRYLEWINGETSLTLT